MKTQVLGMRESRLCLRTFIFLLTLSAIVQHSSAALTTSLSLAQNNQPRVKPTTESATNTSNTITRRAESSGSSCSSEGQWNCMTDSWQRCASGKWSVVMDCAAGTVCAPSGLTDDMRVEHDGSVNGNGGGGSGGTGGSNHGPRGSVSLVLVVAVSSLWLFWGR